MLMWTLLFFAALGLLASLSVAFKAAQVASGAFDYNNTTSGVSFAGDEVQPLAITAAIVVAATDGGSIAGATASLVGVTGVPPFPPCG